MAPLVGDPLLVSAVVRAEHIGATPHSSTFFASQVLHEPAQACEERRSIVQSDTAVDMPGAFDKGNTGGLGLCLAGRAMEMNTPHMFRFTRSAVTAHSESLAGIALQMQVERASDLKVMTPQQSPQQC